MLIAPLIAPLLGAGIGGFFSTALGSGLLTGALTALESRDTRQGVMAGLMGGGISGLLGSAGQAAGAGGADAAGQAAMASTPTADFGGAAAASMMGGNEAASFAGFDPSVFTAQQAVPEGLWGGEGVRAAMTQPAAMPQSLPTAQFTSSMEDVPGFLGRTPAATVAKAAKQAAYTGPKSVFDGGSFSGNLSDTFGNVQTAMNTPGWMEKAIKGPGMMAGLGWLGLQSAQEQAAAEEERKAARGPARASSYNTYGYKSGFAGGGLAAVDPGTMAGRYIKGSSDGVTDSLSATIDGQQPARLSHGEYVVDAHTVSALGNGNSEAGAAKLKQMQERVRTKKYGTSGMPKKINPRKMMPA